MQEKSIIYELWTVYPNKPYVCILGCRKIHFSAFFLPFVHKLIARPSVTCPVIKEHFYEPINKCLKERIWIEVV